MTTEQRQTREQREQAVAELRSTALEKRRAYMRTAKAISRKKAKAAAAEGRVEARADVVRDVLADAAIILLATGAPGADAIERLLGKAFSARPGVVGTLKAKARSGRLRPRVLTPELLRNE